MKVFAIIIPIIIIVIGGWYLSFQSIVSHTDNFNRKLNELSIMVKNSNWEEAQDDFSEIKNKWKQLRNKWTIFFDNHEIDNIDLAMAKVAKYIETNNSSLASGEIEILKELFRIAKENEALSLTNLL
ncbi:MAG: DUF4363 family protein [Halanaerobiales bacterium]